VGFHLKNPCKQSNQTLKKIPASKPANKRSKNPSKQSNKTLEKSQQTIEYASKHIEHQIRESRPTAMITITARNTRKKQLQVLVLHPAPISAIAAIKLFKLNLLFLMLKMPRKLYSCCRHRCRI
jgi:hypothetical protein